MSIESYTAKLDSQLSTCRNWSEVEDHLPTPVSDEAEWADAVQVAFSLWFHVPDRPDELARFPNLVVPSEQTLRSWQSVLDQSAEPVVQARLGDLLWQLPAKPRRHRQSRIASQAYEQLAGRWTGLDAKNALIRALQLALELDDHARAASLIATAMSEFDTTIDDAAPGVSFGYLGILIYAPPGLRSTDLPSRFERAKTVYAAQPHLLKQLIEMQMHLAGGDPVQRAALDQELIHVFLRAAEHSAGLASYLHLQSAIQAAQNYPALRDIAMARQRKFDLTSLGAQAATVTLKIDPHRLHQHRACFLDRPNWQEAIEKMLELPPPSGYADANSTEARASIDRDVFRFAVSQHLVNADYGHARTLDSEDEFDWELGQIELRRFQVEAELLLVPVLSHLPVRHHIERGALRAWLREHHEGDECALIEESLWRWWNGDDDTVCALLLIPAIESLVQHRAEQRGIAVTSPAVGRRRAGFKSLGDLLASLSNRMDESWRRYLLCVLVSEYGLNLRNDLCHGIRLSASSRDVAALVIAALHLIRMPDAEP